MAKNTDSKARQKKNKKYMLVRYGRMNELGWFEHNEAQVPKSPKRVVVKTEKGLELGQIVGQLSPYRKGQFKLNQDQLDEYYRGSEVDFACDCSGKFIRYASSADVSEEKHLRKISTEEIDCCKRFAEELNLPMKIVDVEHIFGGERIVFYFMADGRIDFRELVKKLAQEYQTRIELRQIGSRDEAKLLGDLETCGQQCCCQRFLKTLKPINMRMAKMQKATLDPSKISGYCGRLKCCLRYEDVTYQELKRKLPKKNAKVKTEYGEGKIVDTQILTQLVMVESENGERFSVPVEEIEIIDSVKAEAIGDNSEEETKDQNENGSNEQ
jgi:cell fate regulator YaaT (PSP1 superfamily)